MSTPYPVLTDAVLSEAERERDSALAHAPRPRALVNRTVRRVALGALAMGAFALGAFVIGRLTIGALSIARARIRRLEIDELVVRQAR